MSGVALVSGLTGGWGQLSPLGLLLIIGSALAYTTYSLISQKSVIKVSPLSITNTLTLGSLLIILLLFHDLSFISALSLKSVGLVLLMTVLNTLIAVVFFLKAVQKNWGGQGYLAGNPGTCFSHATGLYPSKGMPHSDSAFGSRTGFLQYFSSGISFIQQRWAIRAKSLCLILPNCSTSVLVYKYEKGLGRNSRSDTSPYLLHILVM